MPKQKLVNGEFVELTSEEEAELTQPRDPTPDPIPSRITAVNMRKALRAIGLAGDVAEWLDAQTADVRDEWEYSTYFERTHPTFQAGVQALGLDDATLDALFSQYGEFPEPRRMR